MKWAIAIVLLMSLCSKAHSASKKRFPHILRHVTADDGARFTVSNPSRASIKFRLSCKDAFSVDWMYLSPHTTKKVTVLAMEPIKGPCDLVWRFVRR